ncbi:type II toxin-antitoxin system VapC family toxin [uncultured Enterovirga sp.]|uniref:type II toxin-antitoxin system VapC family toxin n=1 Tax=uncultured Enterovirga sp. TaxID=2026352 RepID=UPI0035CA9C1A
MLDADICIALERGPGPHLAERLLALEPGEAVVSLVAYGELRVGIEKSRHRDRALKALDRITAAFPVATPAVAVAQAYGSIRADLERRGTIIGENDLWIAAHARSVGLILVSANEREFRRVPGLSVENWAAE